MRNYAYEIVANTVFRDEFFSGIDNVIGEFRDKGDFEAVVSFKTIKKRALNYIETVEN